MNVEDWEAAALHEIVARVEAEAAARGVEVLGSELVGLMPAGAAAAAAGAALRIDGFDAVAAARARLLDSAPDYTRAVIQSRSRSPARSSRSRTSGPSRSRARPPRSPTAARERMRAAREVVDARRARRARAHVWRSTPGFGRFVSASIPEELTEELQLRLLRSHACGVGEPYPPEVVRAAMLLRANTLAKGYSGARIETVELLIECINRGLLPSVPSRGSVGASGDLAPLAHLALPLVGEGEAWLEGELLPGGDALERVGLEPVRCRRRRGSRSINGTQFMAAVGALGLVRARRLAKAADLACAMSLEALQGSRTSFIPADPCAATVARAARVGGERAAAARRLGDQRVASLVRQGAGRVLASLRAAGARRVPRPARLRRATRSRVELNAATDNPLVLVERRGARLERELPRAAGRVRARRARDRPSPSSRASRSGAIERLVNPSLSDGLPRVSHRRRRPQLRVHDPAVRRGCARVARTRCSRIPRASTRSRRARGRRITSRWATPPGSRRWQVLANGERVLAIELLAGAQGVEFLAPLEPGSACSATRRVRAHAVAAARRRPVAGGRHRGGRRRDPRRLARRGRRGRGRSARSDASRAGRTRGRGALRRPLARSARRAAAELNARSWSTEAPLRMLLNNLDAEVAERPEELVVYGGSGKAARSHEALQAIVATLLRLGDDETLLVQSGKPVGVFRTHPGAPRVLIANSLLVPALGDVGRVPPARGARADDVRPDDGGLAGSTSARRGSCRGRTRRSRRRARRTSARPTSPGGRS